MNKQEAHKYVGKCGECGGSGESNTIKNGGSLLYFGDRLTTIPCPHCQEGWVVKMKECPECNGLGGYKNYPLDPITEICSTCKGECQISTGTDKEIKEAIKCLEN